MTDTTDRDLILTRIIDAPPELLKQLFVPKPYTALARHWTVASRNASRHHTYFHRR